VSIWKGEWPNKSFEATGINAAAFFKRFLASRLNFIVPAKLSGDVRREKNHERVTIVPTALRIGPYRFFFYAGDRDEPQHIHVERDDKIAKFWLDPIRLQSSGGFNRVELGRIQEIIREHHRELMEAWYEYFRS
jgi:hypothetical protein